MYMEEYVVIEKNFFQNINFLIFSSSQALLKILFHTMQRLLYI
ncbi:hypothetical protein ROSINTL182_08057 [Roseburia intestinalis L1-82]|uniref:Uncharacterized protein n=1 Tax=Roseburia intestinalis L1-82 TaxID=536231 RepID=C7GDQ6_9FIRM|nr:hypothetical protein ROSINTL182_08057 [Roseburia intestinalis L1-82]